MSVIKELKGHSGSQVLLVQDQITFVRKIGYVDRNLERYAALSKLGLRVPNILHQENDSYDMEFIHNLDIKNYLFKNQVQDLFSFIKNTIFQLSTNTVDKDYSEVYAKKLKNVDFTGLVFTREELISKLPVVLPSSEYHGDFTLENILYDIVQKDFVMIDPLTSEYDSYVFDLAKLRQDVDCKWFLRNDDVYIDPKLQNLSEELSAEFETYSNSYIVILMLLRVLPYTKGSDNDFIIKKANSLWK
jgi:tRNA A-37 threonylcarbamoyl transferase component Bud32